MAAYVLAEKELATSAVKALVAELTVVGGDSVTDLEALNVLLKNVRCNPCGRRCKWPQLTLPTAAMTPTVSWPGIRGNLAINSPSWICYKLLAKFHHRMRPSALVYQICTMLLVVVARRVLG